MIRPVNETIGRSYYNGSDSDFKRKLLAMRGIAQPLTLCIVVAVLFLVLAGGPACVAEEFKMQGKITKITGNLVTVRDASGKEQTVESRLPIFKVGDAVSLTITMEKWFDLQLSPQDGEFLTKRCHVDPADVTVLPRLNRSVKLGFKAGLGAHDEEYCVVWEGFRATREYLRKYKVSPDPAPEPPTGYNRYYLTREENDYTDNTACRTPCSASSLSKATITVIGNDQITVTDEKGKQTIVRGSTSSRKVGDVVEVTVNIFRSRFS
jgi:hypothetical protein